MTRPQERVLRNLAACRTEALGGHADVCDGCGALAIAYNSCRDRHCPQCQGGRRAKWLAERHAELLPVEYFHVVFTLPHELAPWAWANRRRLYGLLFETTAATLLEVATNPKRLGAQLGFTAVLHTWGQNLEHHPHLHCIVPGGGLSFDKTRWVSCRAGFFLPVRVLSRLFRGKFLAGFRALLRDGEVVAPSKGADHPAAVGRLLDALYAKEWVVYAKPPFGGPQQMLKYLARYTHRVALSNDRLLRMDQQRVTFSWKDYARNGQRREMTLEGAEFLRRFLLHVAPKGFRRIRSYGWLANRGRHAKLALVRSLLPPVATPVNAATTDRPSVASDDNRRCPRCGKGQLHRSVWRQRPTIPELFRIPGLWDSS